MNDDVDILIIGGGLIGAALMQILANKNDRLLMVEAESFSTRLNAGFDARTLALSPASINILKTLGLWASLADKATPIHCIHVSEQGRFGTARLHKQNEEPLGYVIELQTLQQALYQNLPSNALVAPARLISLDETRHKATIQHGEEQREINANLVVAADGGHSTVRQLVGLPVQSKAYGQHALIANIGLNRDHGFCAYERFTPSGPMAMLPMTEQRAALVWCLPPDEAHAMMQLNESLFLKRLQQHFGYKLGRFVKVGQRMIYPLHQRLMPQVARWPVVFIGNAAHTLHPIAGQGFNLGLRDAAALAQCILQHGLQPAMLSTYENMRQYDQNSIATLTHGLIRLFQNPLPGFKMGRNLGLMLFDNIPILKSTLALYASGYAGILPDLVCGIHLEETEGC